MIIIGNYVTNQELESVDVGHPFHDQDLSLDHGLTAVTASEGLEGPPMILTPPASPDQPGMQSAAKDVMVDVPSHEIGSKS